PTDEERQIQKTILLFQFTYIGAPYIYYGDEVGMWGADDPDCRKPMVWEEFKYEDETHHPFGLERSSDTVEIDEELFQFYKSIIKLRKEHESLRRGKYGTVLIDDDRSLFAFERWNDAESIRVIFNLSDQSQAIDPDEFLPNKDTWTILFGDSESNDVIKAKSGVAYINTTNG
ncbi:DUF3459 domain-containing protein, partial [bacterium]|nr:DUF3459 domain-containing protein [bacterium]MBU1635199.1 DUF3459 domain-containing protein [bacterium]